MLPPDQISSAFQLCTLLLFLISPCVKARLPAERMGRGMGAGVGGGEVGEGGCEGWGAREGGGLRT